jgi:4-hydroxy-tetrahydrodipicolinate reductase
MEALTIMRIVITGAAGRMGRRLIANIAESKDLKLAGATERQGSEFLGLDAGSVAGCAPLGVKITQDLAPLLKDADAIIDFSTGSVLDNVRAAAKANCAAVVGTTALGDEAKSLFAKLASEGARIVYASNYSIGVNLLFHISKQVAKTLGDAFEAEIVELHHNLKKDSPSGTAVSLAEVIAEAKGMTYKDDVVHGREGLVGARPKKQIGMHAVRGGDVVGEHTAFFFGQGERLELTHKASSRDTFALGALRAARFLSDAKPGLYDMRDVLGLK